MLDVVGYGEFLPNSQILDDLAKYVCPDQAIDVICENVIFLICGFDKSNINIVSRHVSLSWGGGESFIISCFFFWRRHGWMSTTRTHQLEPHFKTLPTSAR